MSEATLRCWLAAPMEADVSEAVDRLRRAPGVVHVAVMPDVHLGTDVCIGVAMATSGLLYPQAVGGDIGCGMLAVAFDCDAGSLEDARVAARILRDLGQLIPARRHRRDAVVEQPAELLGELSEPRLEALRRSEGALEFATLGSGNHFLELQRDEEGRLWLMLHSGSRAMGQAIRDHHLARACLIEGRWRPLEAESDAGAAYLRDANWARRYAHFSRQAMAKAAESAVGHRLCWETAITTDHNHVERETHGGRDLWVHRKGAMPAYRGRTGVLPGSMGTLSFHVEGRGDADALGSSAHGAGRALSRSAAREKVSERELRRQMDGVFRFPHGGAIAR